MWVCLTCLHVGCSRFARSHALEHAREYDHPVVYNFKTRSVWCYECNSYVTNESLSLLTAFVNKDYEADPLSYQPYFSSFNVEGVAKYIISHKVKNIIALVGAGLSTSAGIPDFRSANTGLYFNLQKYKLPYPEAVFDLEYFPSNPAPFYEVMKEMYPGLGKYFPTPSHFFLKQLNDQGILKRVYTQNIDGLESVAGLPDEKVVCSHGTFRTSHCIKCGKFYPDTSVFLEQITKGEIFKCECGGYVKPDIVFFNESLPEVFFERIKTDFDDCDMLMVFGTSLVVYPFASLVDAVPINCPRVVVNREKVGKTMDFSEEGRDIALLGDCDDVVLRLCKALGWSLQTKSKN